MLCDLAESKKDIDQIREAMRINPYHPDWYWTTLGKALYRARRYDDAIEAYKRKANPQTWVLSRLAASYAQLGRMDEATKIVAAILRVKPDFSMLEESNANWGVADVEHFREGMRKAGLPD